MFFRQVFSPRYVRTIFMALKSFVPQIKMRKILPLTKLCFGVVYAQSTKLLNYENEEHEEDLKRATQQGEKYLSQLICMLRTLILETSMEYQECLIKQIELTKVNTELGPIGSHWDELTAIRSRAHELKDELHKYQALAKNIGNVAESQNTPLHVENELVLNTLNDELNKLRKLCDVRFKEINKYERLLLEANRDSILYNQKE